MAIRAHLDPPSRGNTTRSAPRRALRLEASGLAPDGDEANVTIHNISAAGLLIETALELAQGEELAIDLPEAGIVTAVIVWRSAQLYGCAFARTLGPAALAAAQLQGQSRAAPDTAPEPSLQSAARAGEALGPRLNRLRRDAGLTLADVAAALGVSKPTVWAWEKGKARPLPERLEAIAAALGIAPDTLIEAPAGVAATDAVIADCRARIAEAWSIPQAAVRIMIEL